MITLWNVGSIIEKYRDSLAKSAGEEVSSHIGRWIFTDRLRLEQGGELGKKTAGTVALGGDLAGVDRLLAGAMGQST